jgi:hypothetical protein
MQIMGLWFGLRFLLRLRLRLATSVLTGIEAQTPRLGEIGPQRGDLPCLAQMSIWLYRDWIEPDPTHANTRVFPATPRHAGARKRGRSRRLVLSLDLEHQSAAVTYLSVALPRDTTVSSRRHQNASAFSYPPSMSSPTASSPTSSSPSCFCC